MIKLLYKILNNFRNWFVIVIHFFHSSSWNLESISTKWFEVVKNFVLLYYEGDAVILIVMVLSKAKKHVKCQVQRNFIKNQKTAPNIQ